jgi:hypothetical protein
MSIIISMGGDVGLMRNGGDGERIESWCARGWVAALY